MTRREEKLLRGLSQRKIREAEGCFLVEGIRLVEDLLDSGLEVRFLVHSSSLEDTERGRRLLRAAEGANLARHGVTHSELARLADTQSPQGVVAVAETPRAGIDDLVPSGGRAVVLALDAVQDPGNFGTLVRTADALGAHGVIALPGTVDPWNAKAVRSAMGSSFRLPVVHADWDVIDPWLETHGFATLVAALDGQPPADDLPRRSVLVVGNEGAGVSAESRARADRLVGIPLRGRAESLNVAAAAAILMYQLLR